MGGSSKGQTAPTTSDEIVASMPAYMKNVTPAQIPAFMPGQLDFLSKDLSAGFGPTPKAFVDYLRQINQPAQTMNYGTAPVPKAAPKAAPKATTKPVRSPLNLPANFSDRDRQDLINRWGYDPFTGR